METTFCRISLLLLSVTLISAALNEDPRPKTFRPVAYASPPEGHYRQRAPQGGLAQPAGSVPYVLSSPERRVKPPNSLAAYPNALHAYPNPKDLWMSTKLQHLFRYEVSNAEKLRKKAVALKVVSILAIVLSSVIAGLGLVSHFLKKKTILARSFDAQHAEQIFSNILAAIQDVANKFESSSN